MHVVNKLSYEWRLTTSLAEFLEPNDLAGLKEKYLLRKKKEKENKK
jgi:hypothetical protein